MSWNNWKKRALKAEGRLRDELAHSMYLVKQLGGLKEDLAAARKLSEAHLERFAVASRAQNTLDDVLEVLDLLLKLNPELSRHRLPLGRIEKWDLAGMRKAAAYEDSLDAYEKHGAGFAIITTEADERGYATVSRGKLNLNDEGFEIA